MTSLDLLTWRPPGPDRRDHAARWLAFVAERPDVAIRVITWCQAKHAAGERVSMAKCWEELRGTIGRRLLDNSWRRPAALWCMAQDPALVIAVKGER